MVEDVDVPNAKFSGLLSKVPIHLLNGVTHGVLPGLHDITISLTVTPLFTAIFSESKDNSPVVISSDSFLVKVTVPASIWVPSDNIIWTQKVTWDTPTG